MESRSCVQTERYHALAEERKRDKENAKSRRDKMQTLKDIEARAEADNLPMDVKPSAAQLADAQLLRHEASLPACTCLPAPRVAMARALVLLHTSRDRYLSQVEVQQAA